VAALQQRRNQPPSHVTVPPVMKTLRGLAISHPERQFLDAIQNAIL
jgi:hypothetical protein